MNRRSRTRPPRLLPFTALLCLLAVFPTSARADRVVLLPSSGALPEERLEALGQSLAAALRGLGHDVVSEGAGLLVGDAPEPETANEMRAVAEIQGARYLIVSRGFPRPGGIHLVLRVGFAPETRLEVLETEVRDSRVDARLAEVLAALIRPEGLGADAARLGGEDRVAREAEAASETSTDPCASDPSAAGCDPCASDPSAAGCDPCASDPSAEGCGPGETPPPRYNAPPGLTLSFGLGAHPIVSHGPGASGGALGTAEIGLGRTFSGVAGLELRGGLDLVYGATSGFSLHGGVAYVAGPLAGLPLYFGGGLDLGVLSTLTGNKATFFIVRVGPILSYRVTDRVSLEAQAHLTTLLGGDGAITFGGSGRVGYRF